MGAKAGILAFGDGDFAEALRQLPTADAAPTAGLVADIFPGYQVERVRGWPLTEATYPPDDEVQALSAPGIAVLCAGRLVLAKPSELPGHVLDLAAGRRVAPCAMHSVDDSFEYAVWNNGELMRSLSVSLRRGIIEEVEENLSSNGRSGQAAGPSLPHPGALGFHPLDVAQQAAREAALGPYRPALRVLPESRP